MPSLIPTFQYDLFISYRHNDNLDGWVSDFVQNLEKELRGTLKEPLSIYFDKNPHDGLLETHNVDKSLEGKLKCLIFIPIISQTYCDPKSFAWQHEFVAFNKLAKEDQFGRDIKLSNGNVASRILPIKIHELDADDKTLLENELDGALRAIEFIFKSSGVNRPLTVSDKREENSNKTFYRDQVNKVANAIKEIITAIKNPNPQSSRTKIDQQPTTKAAGNKKPLIAIASVLLLALAAYFFYPKLFPSTGKDGALEKSIAVIPFKLIGNDQEGKYFAEGVADALINHLHGIQNLKVRSRSSVEKYAGSDKTILEMGEELNVQYILEGSAQKYKDDIRIIVQLINTQTDEHLWFKEYNEKFENIFKIQSEIALNITSELNIKLGSSQKKRVQKIPTKNLEAWDLYLRGMEYHENYWKHWENADINIAAGLYKEAIRKDPEFALGYAMLARASVKGEGTIEMTNDSILMLLNKAIELDPELPDSYENLGLFYLNAKEYDKALANIEKAIQLDPHQFYFNTLARFYARKGDHLKALSTLNEGLNKERTRGHEWLLFNSALSYLCVGEPALAEEFTNAALLLAPDNLLFLEQKAKIQMVRGNYNGMLQTAMSLSIRNEGEGLALLGWVYLLMREFEKSEKAYAQFFSRSSDITKYYTNHKINYAYVLRKLGKENEALATIKEDREYQYPNYGMARAFSFLGEKQKALEALSKWKPTDGLQEWMEKDPLFESIKEDPAFKGLVKQFKAEIEILRKQSEAKRAKGEFPTLDMIGKDRP